MKQISLAVMLWGLVCVSAQGCGSAVAPDSTPAPVLTSITPIVGLETGGTAVAVSASGLVSGAVVTIGGVAATTVGPITGTGMNVTTPAHAVTPPNGALDVVVTNPNGHSSTLAAGFGYTSVYEGTTWSGTTSQTRAISFGIDRYGRINSLILGFNVALGGGCTVISEDFTYGASNFLATIAAGAFAVSDPANASLKVNGTFSSTTAVAGTASAIVALCGNGAISSTWSATRK